ncbi:hypothetical protein V2S66_04470 [Streptomyces sp. V4-01]|uniref:Uncharacterized protein n=1 Tax=Actinacidiphila polyblastidii TaxID=3110430 RepID=A0ABU7P5Y1_9ACTN|nr:hypothetical protein [Streptomyces sp. V4-01]
MATEKMGAEGRKKQKRSGAAEQAREAARYLMTVVKVGKDLLDLIQFIDRHL